MADSEQTVASPSPNAKAFGSPATQFAAQDGGLNRRGTRRTTVDTQHRASYGSSRRPASAVQNGNMRRTLSRMTASIMAGPDRPVGKAPSPLQSLKAIILASWLNLLLVFIPVSWVLHFVKPDSHTLIFVFSFLAIIPLAKLLGFATEELSMRTGQTIAGLLNATLGNAVELIVSIIALIKCELQVVQSSLIGSILSNILLVLGMCFFAGGTRFSEQGFGAAAAQINASLLIISVVAILLPAAFHFSINSGTANEDNNPDQDILAVSHGVALILLFIYGAYLLFQLWSHAHLYEDNTPDIAESKRYIPSERQVRKRKEKREKKRAAKAAAGGITNTEMVQSPTAEDAPQVHGADGDAAGARHANGDPEAASLSTQEEEEEETPLMSLPMSIVLLVIVTVLVAVTAEWLVDSIDGLTESNPGITKEFVGVILLPIVGNAAEHVTAVTVAVKDKLTLSIGVAVGSSIQIALFVIPFIVTLAWMMGKPLTLLFDPFESIAVFLAVITVNYAVADGKSNWLEGLLLMSLYIILGVVFYFYPGTDPSKALGELVCNK